MAEHVEALVEPELLVWARKSAGLDLDLAANKIQVDPKRLSSWENGEARPTINQLRKIANVYKRPIAVFFLPKPPKDFSPLTDFRRLSGQREPLSRELQVQIRFARDRRQIALDLYADSESPIPQLPFYAKLKEDPDSLAARLRTTLGMTRDRQTKFHSDQEFFNWWRTAIEKNGALVFQTTGVKVSEMRGFSIGERPLPVVVLNNKDSLRGRIFTMLHEFIHILLERGGLCDLREESDLPPAEKTVEVFCNRVAGAALVSKDDLLLEEVVLRKSGTNWTEDEIDHLAQRYRVSREVIVRRLLICHLTTLDFYKKKRQEFEKKYAEIEERSGFALPHQKAMSAAGPSFVRLVLDSYYRENITAGDVSDFLNIKLKHLEKIEHALAGSASGAGVAA